MATIQKGLVLKEDQNLWDGITRTDTRIDSTGGTITGNRVGESVDVLLVYGSGTDYTSTTINLAIASLSNYNVSLLLTVGTWNITADVTVPSNLTMVIPEGCILNISTGITVTFNGNVYSHNPVINSGLGSIVYGKKNINPTYYAQTAEEIALGIVPTNYDYEFGWVERYGAVGDNSTDDADAIINCILAVKQARATATSVLTIGTNYEVNFSGKAYYVSKLLTTDTNQFVNDIVFKGNGTTILRLAAGITAFGGLANGVRFEGIKFMDGATALSIKTNNTDVSTVRLVDCEFHNMTGDIITTDATSGGGLNFNAYRCKFVIPQAALHYSSRVLYAQSGDVFVFEDCQVYAKNNTNGYFYNTGRLILRHMFGVPMADPPGSGTAQLIAWIDNYGSVEIDHCRLGGEGSGPVNLIRNYETSDVTYPVNSSGINIKNSTIYCQDSFIAFYAIPNIVSVEGCRGLVDANSLYFDSTIISADLTNIGALTSQWSFRNNSFPVPEIVDYTTASVDDIVVKALPLVLNDPHYVECQPLDAASVLANEVGNTGGYGASSSGTATASSGTDEFGLGTKKYTSTGDGQNGTTTLTTILSSATTSTAGVYTFVVSVYVSVEFPLVFQVTVCNTVKRYTLTTGRHTLSIPFYYDAATHSASVSVSDMPDTAVYEIERWQLYTGQRVIKQKRVIVHDSAAPGSGKFQKADMVISTGITVDASNMLEYAYICTVTGSPGTWKTLYLSTVSPAT